MERRNLSRNYLRDAYQSMSVPTGEPVLQILGFEVSLHEDSTIMYFVADAESGYRMRLCSSTAR